MFFASLHLEADREASDAGQTPAMRCYGGFSVHRPGRARVRPSGLDKSNYASARLVATRCCNARRSQLRPTASLPYLEPPRALWQRCESPQIQPIRYPEFFAQYRGRLNRNLRCIGFSLRRQETFEQIRLVRLTAMSVDMPQCYLETDTQSSAKSRRPFRGKP